MGNCAFGFELKWARSSPSGHALNKIIKDIINRFNVLLGRKVQ